MRVTKGPRSRRFRVDALSLAMGLTLGGLGIASSNPRQREDFSVGGGALRSPARRRMLASR